MEIWAKHKKENRVYRTSTKQVEIKHEADGYVYVCESSQVLKELQIRYGFLVCAAPETVKTVSYTHLTLPTICSV